VDLDLPNAAFDLVLCQQGLQFFPDRAAAVREIRRVRVADARAPPRVPSAVRGYGAPSWRSYIRNVSFSLGDLEELRKVLRDGGFDRIDITPQSLEISLQSPELFVQLTVRGAATSVPAFARLDAQAQSALVEAVSGEMEPIIGRYRRGDELTFPMHTNIAIAT
jgi:SAM-dependent methyltransferase